jgi:hypothetical protein
MTQNSDSKEMNFDILSDIRIGTWLQKRIMHAMQPSKFYINALS